MARSPKRVLLVDNDVDVLNSVALNLKVAGYRVLTTESKKAALNLMAREIFHLAIIDIRLEDERHKRDTSGFQVARAVPAYIPCVIYTAYEDKENIRQALGKVGAKEIVDKTQPDAPSKLINIVDHLFASELKVNFDLEIEGSLDLDKMAVEIEIPTPDKELQPSSDDIRQVFQALFYDATGVHVASLLSPESAPTLTQAGSILIRARPHFENAWGVPVAIKFGARDEVEIEANSYRRIKPFLGGQRLAVLEREAYSRQIGGLVYTLIGAGDWETIRPFDKVFLNEPADMVIGLLERFFSQTFQTLFVDAPREAINLTATYTRELHLTPQKLQAALEKFQPEALTKTRLQFKGLKGSFRNPIIWALPGDQFRRFEVLSRKCLCHGDLHSQNILVDAEGHFWLIDFARATEGHALRDFAELEADIKFNLLPVADLEALLPFERALLAPANFQDAPPDMSFANSRLDHTYQVVLALRDIAANLINLEGDMREYYQAIFFHTLKIMRLRHIYADKKEHALLSAALICERLDDWPHWPTPSPSTPSPESVKPNDSETVEVTPSSPPPGQLRLIGAAAGFVIALSSFLILFWLLENALISLLILIVVTIIAFPIAGITTGKDALLILGDLVKRLLDKLGL